VGPARLPGRTALAGSASLACLARLRRSPGRPLTAAVGARSGCRRAVVGVAAKALGARAARGRGGAVAGNPPPVRHDGLLRRRTDAAGALRSGAIAGSPAVWLSPPRPRPRAAAGRERRRVFRPGPRAVRRAPVARRRARRSGREARARRHAAVRTAAGRAGRHVGRPGPVAGAASVAGIDRVGARVQGGTERGVLRVAIAIGGLGGPAARATAWAGRIKRAALTIHPLPPDPERVRRAQCPVSVAALALHSSVGRAARRGMAVGQLA
jgi:hypothetical protein